MLTSTTTTTSAPASFTTLPTRTETATSQCGAIDRGASERDAVERDHCGPSPEEVYRRVREIRASWDLEERIARRREAQNRFENLIEALCGGHAA